MRLVNLLVIYVTLLTVSKRIDENEKNIYLANINQLQQQAPAKPPSAPPVNPPSAPAPVTPHVPVNPHPPVTPPVPPVTPADRGRSARRARRARSARSAAPPTRHSSAPGRSATPDRLAPPAAPASPSAPPDRLAPPAAPVSPSAPPAGLPADAATVADAKAKANNAVNDANRAVENASAAYETIINKIVDPQKAAKIRTAAENVILVSTATRAVKKQANSSSTPVDVQQAANTATILANIATQIASAFDVVSKNIIDNPEVDTSPLDNAVNAIKNTSDDVKKALYDARDRSATPDRLPDRLAGGGVNDEEIWRLKYLKYKQKYLALKQQMVQ